MVCGDRLGSTPAPAAFTPCSKRDALHILGSALGAALRASARSGATPLLALPYPHAARRQPLPDCTPQNAPPPVQLFVTSPRQPARLPPQRLVCGDSNGLDAAVWRAAVRVEGAAGEGPAALSPQEARAVCWFWAAVDALAPEQQRLLLQFWSGSDSVPVEVGGAGVARMAARPSDVGVVLGRLHSVGCAFCRAPTLPTLSTPPHTRNTDTHTKHTTHTTHTENPINPRLHLPTHPPTHTIHDSCARAWRAWTRPSSCC